MAKLQLVVRYKGDVAAVWLLDVDDVMIGRSDEADIDLEEDEFASRQHAIVRRSGQSWLIEDLGNKNGTLVNGKRRDKTVLMIGDVIDIGEHSLTCEKATLKAQSLVDRRARRAGADFETAAESESGLDEPTQVAPDEHLAGLREVHRITRQPHIEVLIGEESQLRLLTSATLRVGYTDECEIRLPGRAWLTPVAATITKSGGGFYVESHSTLLRPIHLNGVKVRGQARLHDGFVLTVGRARLVFHKGTDSRR